MVSLHREFITVVTPESAKWRTDPASSRSLKPPPLGGGVFTSRILVFVEVTNSGNEAHEYWKQCSSRILERVAFVWRLG